MSAIEKNIKKGRIISKIARLIMEPKGGNDNRSKAIYEILQSIDSRHKILCKCSKQKKRDAKKPEETSKPNEKGNEQKVEVTPTEVEKETAKEEKQEKGREKEENSSRVKSDGNDSIRAQKRTFSELNQTNEPNVPKTAANEYKIINYTRFLFGNANANRNTNTNASGKGSGKERIKAKHLEKTMEEITKKAIMSKYGHKNARAQMRSKKGEMEQPATTMTIGMATMTADEGNNNNSISWELSYPDETLSDVGGIEHMSETIKNLLLSLCCCDIWSTLGAIPPRSVLLHGPPGSGKTLLANALAGEAGVGFLSVSAPELVQALSGQSEAKIRSLFDTALANAPCILFIDEIDVIASKREDASKDMEKRIVAQLLTCLDNLARHAMEKAVLFIAATNRPDSIDSALRRGDRFDRELAMGIPDKKGRKKILSVITQTMKLEEDFDFDLIAEKTSGFVGADLKALTKEAGVIGVKRILRELKLVNAHWSANRSANANDSDNDGDDDNNNNNNNDDNNNGNDNDNDNDNDKWNNEIEDLQALEEGLEMDYSFYRNVRLNAIQLIDHYIKESDFLDALKVVQPSARREGFATIPDVSWNEIGALNEVRKVLEREIIDRISYKKLYQMFKVDSAAGVLLYGPPGCGKTLLAKAVASQSGASFISIKGPELLNKYVGESERAVRTVFDRARSSQPCVVFFDELDALAPRRDSDASGNHVSQRVVNQLLTEMDGIQSRGDIFVIGATNRADIIDEALMRPGRFGKKIYIPLPDKNGRLDILKKQCTGLPIDEKLIEHLVNDKRCEGFSGADLAQLAREASLALIDELQHIVGPSHDWKKSGNNYKHLKKVVGQDKDIKLEMRHFEKAFKEVRRSVSDEARDHHEHKS
ncbi:hypothetical protein RFI_07458 [Reticulomyxa filosa]|uniref:AAA+ ATPase domain-containing protein n=1 Tax=Reticulomyxa filosa TaxID=46433 RepID=X6NUT5_RETFI|nr:hypothetical protein RFI_07458 [Reticulomyxa filosa]|eukprot:ETO29663.1 hypothetical protein RFI_07458 [Reticulomyxa filosa]